MRIATRIAAAASLAVALTACTTGTSIDGSRHTSYNGVTSIVADSSLVVEVEVQSQSVVKEDIPYTLSTVTVVNGFAPAGLGAALGDAAAQAAAPGELVVRQLGDAETQGLPAPLLEVGSRYLLFLTPSGLPGDASTQFYVTGASAGLYRSDAGTYVHGAFEDGDKLPTKLRTEDLAG